MEAEARNITEESGSADADTGWEEEEAEGEPDSVLIPFVPQIVVDVRLDEGLVLIDPPEGLLELVQPKRIERVVIRGLLTQVAASLQSGVERTDNADHVPDGDAETRPDGSR